MLDHIVRLVEEKAAAIEAGEATAFDPHAAPQQPAEAPQSDPRRFLPEARCWWRPLALSACATTPNASPAAPTYPEAKSFAVSPDAMGDVDRRTRPRQGE